MIGYDIIRLLCLACFLICLGNQSKNLISPRDDFVSVQQKSVFYFKINDFFRVSSDLDCFGGLFETFLFELYTAHRRLTIRKIDRKVISILIWGFTNGSGDLDSISGRFIPKTFKMVLDNSLLSTQKYKVRIKSKVEQSWERSSVLPYTSV